VKTSDVTDKEGRPFAFEVSNTFLTRGEVRKVFGRIPGASLTKSQMAPVREEEFCECELNGKRFVAWEPYGDSSVYWIGPSPPEWNPDIAVFKRTFQGFRPFWGLLKWLPIAAAFIAMGYQFWARNG